MLLEPLAVITPLHIVEATGVSPVVSRENPPAGIDLEAEGIASPFAKDFVDPGAGMIAPDALPLRADGRVGTVLRTADNAGDGAPLGAVQPAIGTPAEAVGDGVRVFEAEPLEMHGRVAIGTIVVIAVGIEQQVRRLQHPQPVAIKGEGRTEAQPFDKDAMLVVATIAIGVFMNRDAIEPGKMPGGWGGNAVVNRAEKLVPRDHLQPGGIGVLNELADPEPTAGVPLDAERLPNVGLGDRHFQFQVIGQLEQGERGGGGLWASIVDALEAAIEFFGTGGLTEGLQTLGSVSGVVAGELGIVARTELPVPRQANAQFFAKQHGSGDVEAGPPLLVVDAEGDHVGAIEADAAGGNQEAFATPQPAPEERGKLPRVAHLAAVDVDLVGGVERFDEELQVTLPPLGGHGDKRAIPRQVLFARRGVLPGLGNLDRLPVGLSLQRSDGGQAARQQPDRRQCHLGTAGPPDLRRGTGEVPGSGRRHKAPAGEGKCGGKRVHAGPRQRRPVCATCGSGRERGGTAVCGLGGAGHGASNSPRLLAPPVHLKVCPAVRSEIRLDVRTARLRQLGGATNRLAISWAGQRVSTIGQTGVWHAWYVLEGANPACWPWSAAPGNWVARCQVRRSRL